MSTTQPSRDLWRWGRPDAPASKGPKRPRDPMVSAIRAVQRARRKTPRGQLEALLAQEMKWRRRVTLAQNKLVKVRQRINQFALAHVSAETPAPVPAQASSPVQSE